MSSNDSWETHYAGDTPVGELAFIIRCKDCAKRQSPFCLVNNTKLPDDAFCYLADVLDDYRKEGHEVGETATK